AGSDRLHRVRGAVGVLLRGHLTGGEYTAVPRRDRGGAGVGAGWPRTHLIGATHRAGSRAPSTGAWSPSPAEAGAAPADPGPAPRRGPPHSPRPDIRPGRRTRAAAVDGRTTRPRRPRAPPAIRRPPPAAQGNVAARCPGDVPAPAGASRRGGTAGSRTSAARPAGGTRPRTRGRGHGALA